DVVVDGQRVLQDVADLHVDSVGEASLRDAFAGDLGDDGQLEHGRAEARVPAGCGDGPRTGTPADVQQAAVPLEVVTSGKGICRTSQDGLDAGRGHLLQLGVEVEDLFGRALSQGIRELRPRRVTDPVPEAQERPEV